MKPEPRADVCTAVPSCANDSNQSENAILIANLQFTVGRLAWVQCTDCLDLVADCGIGRYRIIVADSGKIISVTWAQKHGAGSWMTLLRDSQPNPVTLAVAKSVAQLHLQRCIATCLVMVPKVNVQKARVLAMEPHRAAFEIIGRERELARDGDGYQNPQVQAAWIAWTAWVDAIRYLSQPPERAP